MIIVNQNKDEIVNFDNIMNISICGEDGEYSISAGFIVGRDDNYRELGVYKTEKRAKKVLRELRTRILQTERFEALCNPEMQQDMIKNMYDNDKPLFIYEMPDK